MSTPGLRWRWDSGCPAGPQALIAHAAVGPSCLTNPSPAHNIHSWHSEVESANSRKGCMCLGHASNGEVKRQIGGLRMKLVPLEDRVVVKVLEEEEKTKSGIVLPDTAKEKPPRPKCWRRAGRYDERRPASPSLKEGDMVIFSKYAGTEIKVDGEESSSCAASEHPGQGIAPRLGPANGRPSQRLPSDEGDWIYGKRAKVRRRSPQGSRAWCQPTGRRGQGDPRPQGPLRGARQEVRQPHHHQRRCDHRP